MEKQKQETDRELRVKIKREQERKQGTMAQKSTQTRNSCGDSKTESIMTG